MSTTPIHHATNRVRPALKRLLLAIDRATAAQREVEAARAALVRLAAQSQLQVVTTRVGEEARRDRASSREAASTPLQDHA
jgi:hypothetical protein